MHFVLTFWHFGLIQVWCFFKGSTQKLSGITTRYLYAVVRHPISLGWIIESLLRRKVGVPPPQCICDTSLS